MRKGWHLLSAENAAIGALCLGVLSFSTPALDQFRVSSALIYIASWLTSSLALFLGLSALLKRKQIVNRSRSSHTIVVASLGLAIGCLSLCISLFSFFMRTTYGYRLF